MVIGIFGESCTGKSSVADELSKRVGARIITGKDYLKLAKNEADAKAEFIRLLSANETTGEFIVYVITETEHLSLLPEKALRILAVAELDTIKERFAKRMNGVLPPPVAAMLEKKHGMFNDEKYDLCIGNTGESVSDICDRIMAICGQ